MAAVSAMFLLTFLERAHCITMQEKVLANLDRFPDVYHGERTKIVLFGDASDQDLIACLDRGCFITEDKLVIEQTPEKETLLLVFKSVHEWRREAMRAMPRVSRTPAIAISQEEITPGFFSAVDLTLDSKVHVITIQQRGEQYRKVPTAFDHFADLCGPACCWKLQ